MAPQLSVTFNQPMVAITSNQELARHAVPVELTPQPPGHWRWVGTRTLLFDPRGAVSQGSSQKARFPMATDYHVKIPAGVKSASGARLAAPVRWSFKTPTVTLVHGAPEGGPQKLEPLMWASFNQDIDQQAVLKTIRLKADGRSIPIRMATRQEVAKAHLETLTKKRWVAFKATRKLDPATSYTVTIGPGTPSAEGPLTTTTQQSYSFSTYHRLAVVDHGCQDRRCPPLSPLYIAFNNPIDADHFDPSMVSVSPAIPHMKVDASGRTLLIRGQTKGRTTYTVQLSSQLPDIFGQTLGQTPPLKFAIGKALPRLMRVGGMLVTLDPDEPARFPVYCINEPELEVKITAVKPRDWLEFVHRLQRQTSTHPFMAPGRPVFDGIVKTGCLPDELTEVPIDISPALTRGTGMAVVEVQVPHAHGWGERRVITWVQRTEVGLDAAVDDQSMLAMVTDLQQGRSLPGVELSLLDDHGQVVSQARSGSDGTARLALGSKAPLLVARRGSDVSILPRQASPWSLGGWARTRRTDRLRWFDLDDRNIYRPGEKVSVMGWLRRWQAGPRGDLVGLHGEVGKLRWAVRDSRGNQVLKGTTGVTPDGSFHLHFVLPRNINLGYTSLQMSVTTHSALAGTSHDLQFQVQEFRRPEFEVSVVSQPAACVVGQSALATVKAKYYAGGPLPSAPVRWRVTTTPSHYVPPGRDEYSFGTWTPWWSAPGWISTSRGVTHTKTFQAHTDSSGAQHLKLTFASVDPPCPTVVRAQASVSDVNRQTWSASTTILVHPSDYYVGLSTPTTFVEQGQAVRVKALACDRQGKEVSRAAVRVSMWRNDYRTVHGHYENVREDLVSRQEMSAGKPLSFTFQPSQGGSYTIQARIKDRQGRPNQSTLTVWVSGAARPSATTLKQQQVTLVPDKRHYRPGEVARVLVQSPFYPAEGLLSLRRSGLVSSRRFDMNGPTTVLKIPIKASYLPDVTCHVDLVGSAETAQGPPRPAYAGGQISLLVPPARRTLKVSVVPVHPGVKPGSRTSLTVKVTDASGKPVAGAQVALFAVDEAVLSLTNYRFPDPVALFYSPRGSGVSDYHSRQYVLLDSLDQMLQQGRMAASDALQNAGYPRFTSVRGMVAGAARPMTKGMAPMAMKKAAAQAGQPPIKVRTDFNPTALFAPMVSTDARGQAVVPFKLPDNLTRYRLVALATDGGQRFGKGESSLVARLPLMVRPSPPRFLNFGDACEMPVVLQNQTDRPLDVEVAARVRNLRLTGASGYSLKVPANDRVEVDFPVSTEQAGTAVFQVGAVSGSDSDAAEVSLPVWTPATTEAFATYGQLDHGATAQPIRPPGGVFPQFGGLHITTSSTELQALTDAFVYLLRYPYDCSEAVADRLLAIAALRDVLWAFKAPGIPGAATLNSDVKHDMERLGMLQHYNGGFGFWPTSPRTSPFITVHVTHAMVEARLKGYAVPKGCLGRSHDYLRHIRSHIPTWYSAYARQTIVAYALYVRHLMGDKVVPQAQHLIDESGGVNRMPLAAVGWLYSVLARDPSSGSYLKAIRRLVENRISETAGEAQFVTHASEDSGYVVLASSRRVDGIMLDALMADQPKSDLIPKLVRGLLAQRTRGRWSNTQDNCFVLLALDRYFSTYEKATPDFVARAWLGRAFAGEEHFKGREVNSKRIDIPMASLEHRGRQVLTLAKRGPGRLYYRIGMDYAPRNLMEKPADDGFTVERTYQAVDNPRDVYRDKHGTWHVKAGARVRVRLTMVAPGRRYHVALVDHLPAGLEPLNPALAVTGTVPLDPATRQGRNRWWYWLGTWYQYQNMRDDRVEAFTTWLSGGVYRYSYVARATTPGTFVAPPAKAEEMYAPETFGRSGSDRIIVR